MSREVLDQLDESVACYTLTGEIVYLNPVAERIMGRSLAALTGTNVWELYADERGKAYHAAFLRVAATGVSEKLEQPSARTGRYWVSHILRADGHVWIIGRDATAEKQATARLEILATASKVFAEAAADAATGFQTIARHVATVLGDLCSIRLVSDDGTRFEAPSGIWDVDATVTALLQSLPPIANDADVSRELSSVRSTLLANVDPRLLARRIAPPSEEHRILALGIHSAMVVPMRSQGIVVGLISVCRRAAATAVGYSSGDLQLLEELADRAALVVNQWRALRFLRSAVAVRDEFVSVASHELRTPLAALELQLDGVGRALDRMPSAAEGEGDKLRRRIGNALRQTGRLSSLVSTLLNVSRIASGRIDLQRERVDLATLVGEVVERLEDQATRAGCPIEQRVERDLTGIWDRNRLDQVLTNVLGNALKYGAGKPVTITSERTSERVTLAVQDHGIGVGPLDRERIFDRFERAVSASNYGGLGLGLYIARQIVAAHGGSITVTSELGRGAVFTIELPLEP